MPSQLGCNARSMDLVQNTGDDVHGLAWRTTWVSGVSLALLSISLSSIGVTIQRKGVLRQALGAPEPRPTGRQLFLLGTCLYVVAALPDVVSYALCPQAIVSTVGCCRLVVVGVLAHMFLEERANILSACGMAACVCGTVLCLNFGPTPNMPRCTLLADFFDPVVSTYVALGLVLLVVLIVIEHLDVLTGVKYGPLQLTLLPVAVALAYGLEKVFNTAIGFAPGDLLEEPQWLAVVAAVLCLGALEFYLNVKGVRRMQVQMLVPVVFALSTTIQYFQAVVIFREMVQLSAPHFALSLGGMALSLLGALMIQPPRCCASLAPASWQREVSCQDTSGDEDARPGAGLIPTADRA